MTPLRLRRALTLPKLQNAIDKENADRYLASIPPFVQPVQDIVTMTGFEAIWGRPGLEWKERRLIVMA
jgi:alkylhydroperoxidase/carboxymuconolactone decarboxylase family protein YurZ